MDSQNFSVDAANTATPISETAQLPKLGSLTNLAQSARMKHIKSAKTVLVIIGVLTLGYGAVMFAMAEPSVEAEIKKELDKLGPGFVVDEEKMAVVKSEAVNAHRFGAMLGLAEGIVFLLLGLNVQRAPVPLTAVGLILYIADYAIGSVYDPTYLFKGIVIKIIIIVCLFKALNAAIAYERERKAALAPA